MQGLVSFFTNWNATGTFLGLKFKSIRVCSGMGSSIDSRKFSTSITRIGDDQSFTFGLRRNHIKVVCPNTDSKRFFLCYVNLKWAKTGSLSLGWLVGTMDIDHVIWSAWSVPTVPFQHGLTLTLTVTWKIGIPLCMSFHFGWKWHCSMSQSAVT